MTDSIKADLSEATAYRRLSPVCRRPASRNPAGLRCDTNAGRNWLLGWRCLIPLLLAQKQT